MNNCQCCDAILWSQHARDVGLCPSCESVDCDVIEDLETRLKKALDNSLTED